MKATCKGCRHLAKATGVDGAGRTSCSHPVWIGTDEAARGGRWHRPAAGDHPDLPYWCPLPESERPAGEGSTPAAEDVIRFDTEACGNSPAAHRAQWLRFVTGHNGRPPGADGVSRYAIITARKHSKTTTICALGSWLVSRGARVLMVGATPWQAEDLAARVTRDGGSPVDAAAVCGEVSGAYDAVLLDDVQAVDDGDLRGAEITAWIDGLGDHLAYGASVVVIGSIGRALGTYGEILADPRWGVWTDPAIHGGKVLWPEMWSPSRLESYRAIDPVLFESAFMCGVVYEAGDDRP